MRVRGYDSIGIRVDLGEVADKVGAKLVPHSQRIEQEGLNVKIQGLVIQKQLGQQTEALAVCLRSVNKQRARREGPANSVFLAVHLPQRYAALAVDLVARRVWRMRFPSPCLCSVRTRPHDVTICTRCRRSCASVGMYFRQYSQM